MPVKFVSGDLFADDNINVYAQGCNCAGAMGKGIAISFRQRWPKIYQEYKALCSQGKFTPGDVFVWNEEGKIIFNLVHGGINFQPTFQAANGFP